MMVKVPLFLRLTFIKSVVMKFITLVFWLVLLAAVQVVLART